jgi:electron transfer flavoprotein alpha subunit
MAVLVLAEHTNSALGSATAKAVTAATQLGGDVHVLVAGSGAAAAAAEAGKLDGVAKVLVADAPHLANGLAEEVAALVVPLMAGYDAFIAPSTASGKNVAPRVAALLDVMQVSDITKVLAPDTFERPIYAGNAIQTVKSAEGHHRAYRELCGGGCWRFGARRDDYLAGGCRDLIVRKSRVVKIGSSGVDLGAHHHFGWPGDRQR